MSQNKVDMKTTYTCNVCGVKARLGFYEAQRLGWYWKRRVDIWYDYYCPKHVPIEEKKNETG
jgi:hypothetical protein